MTAIGCQSAIPKSGRSEVTVPLPDGTSATFECAGVSRAAIRRAVLRHRSATAGPPTSPLLAMQLANETVTVTFYIQCVQTNIYDYSPASGEYSYSYSYLSGCWITEIYVDDIGGGGGGSGVSGTWRDQNGNPVPAPSEPIQTTPAVVSDTCKIVTGDRVVKRGEYFFDGALNDGAMQDSLRAAHFESYGTIGNPLPMSERREIGGFFGLNTVTQAYEFHRLPTAGSTRCHFPFQPFDIPKNFAVLGLWHTHPMKDGESYTCPHSADTVWLAKAEEQGGGSAGDWAIADSLQVPMYTIDPERMWRLEPNTPAGLDRWNNPQRWTKGISGQCADVATL